MATRQYLRALAEPPETDTGPIRFVASTEGVKRDGKTLAVTDWTLDNYRANPVVLWAHDYWGERAPIGRADVLIDAERGALISDIAFDQEDPFARSIESKYRRGFMHTVSVGWDPVKTADGPRNDLLDISAVPVPGDPDALMERQARGLRNFGQSLVDLIDLEDEPIEDAEEVWLGTALRMARLFTAAADDSVFDQRAYQRLCRKYRRLGKTAPEVPESIALLDRDSLRGLFLEGEADIVPELFTVPANSVAPDAALVRLHQMIAGGA